MNATQSTIDRLVDALLEAGMAAWRAHWSEWCAALDADATPASPICPICGWVKVPLSDGRLVCRDCGHEQSGGNGDETAAEPDPDAPTCLECEDPPPLEEIAYGQLVCPGCGADWFCRGYYDECRAEMHWDASAQRWALNEMEQ